MNESNRVKETNITLIKLLAEFSLYNIRIIRSAELSAL